MFSSIKTKLTLSIILVFVIALTIITIETSRNTRNMIRSNVETSGFQIASSSANQISLWLQGNLNEIKTLSHQQIFINGDKAEIENELVRLYDLKNPDYEMLFYADHLGNFLTDIRATGSVIDRDYFIHIMQHGHYYSISNPIISRSTGENIIVIAHAVENRSGIVASTIELTTVNEIVSAVSLYETGYGWLVNNEGLIIAHPNEEYDIQDYPELQKHINQSQPFNLLLEDEHVFAYPIELSPGWFLMVSVSEQEINSLINRDIIQIIIMSLAMILITSFVTLLVLKPTLRNIKDSTNFIVKYLSKGDFSKNIPASAIKIKDEYGDLVRGLDQMLKSLRQAFTSINKSQHQVSAAVESLAASSQQINASLETVSATTNEFAGSAQALSENATQMNDTSLKVSDQAETGNKAIENAIIKMHQITDNISDLKNTVISLGTRTQDINKIVETIKTIADQTNLLALNAAIEAARAGDHGRGFAVVADEVKKLAEQSSASATEIENMIKDIDTQINGVVTKTEEGVKTVNEGTETVITTGESLKSILNSIQQMLMQIEQVSIASQEISAGSEEISASIQEQNATMEEIAAFANELKTMVDELDNQFSNFKY